MVDTQLPVETPPAHRQTAELLDAARPAQGRQEGQTGDISPAGQSRFSPLSTEEHRMHAAMLREQSQHRPESDGNALEMQMHSEVIANFFGTNNTAISPPNKLQMYSVRGHLVSSHLFSERNVFHIGVTPLPHLNTIVLFS